MTHRSFLSLVQKSFKNWQEDNIPTWSAALSYYAIFAISPILLLVLSIASLVLDPKDVQTVIFIRLQEFLGRNAAVFLTDSLNSARGGGGISATIIAFLLLLIGATGVFTQLKTTLNYIYKVKPLPTHAMKGFVREKTVGFLMVLIIGLLLLLSITVTMILSILNTFFSSLLPLPQFSLELGNFILTFIITTGVFTFIYRYLPDVNIPRKVILKGALFTALLFTIGKTLLGLYLGLGIVGSGFGAAGSLVIILVWIYISSIIFFFGAELIKNYALEQEIKLLPRHNAVSTEPENYLQKSPTWITEVLSLVVSGVFLRLIGKLFRKK